MSKTINFKLFKKEPMLFTSWNWMQNLTVRQIKNRAGPAEAGSGREAYLLSLFSTLSTQQSLLYFHGRHPENLGLAVAQTSLVPPSNKDQEQHVMLRNSQGESCVRGWSFSKGHTNRTDLGQFLSSISWTWAVPFRKDGTVWQTWGSFPKVLPSLEDQVMKQDGTKGKGSME